MKYGASAGGVIDPMVVLAAVASAVAADRLDVGSHTRGVIGAARKRAWRFRAGEGTEVGLPAPRASDGLMRTCWLLATGRGDRTPGLVG